MNTLIVFAHPEPKSFNGALRDAATEALGRGGHAVRVADLYAQGFCSEAGRGDFASAKDPDYLAVMREQAHAWKTNGFAPDITRAIEDIRWAELVIVQCPMWWFGPPAIVKGWMDRVFVPGFTYGRGKWFESGGLAGKRALLSMTADGTNSSYAWRGRYGDLENLLWPVLLSLRFVGFDVMKPHFSPEVSKSDDQRKALIADYVRRLDALGGETPMFFHAEGDYDENDTLKPEVKARTVAQRD